MDDQEFLRALKQSKLADHGDHLYHRRRPLVGMVRGSGQATARQSQICGAPRLPSEFEWPEHDGGPYRHLLQINFKDVTSCIPEQPTDGILTVFDKFSEDGEMECTGNDYVACAYTPAGLDVVATPPPSDVGLHSAIPISFHRGFDIPLFDPMIPATCENSPIEEDRWRDYGALRDALHQTPDFLFGYPTSRCLGYDPLPGRDWIQLLNLDTDEELSWYFHDGSKLMIFIEKHRLAARDFSRLTTVAG